jgi:steroid Delta-isomerase
VRQLVLPVAEAAGAPGGPAGLRLPTSPDPGGRELAAFAVEVALTALLQACGIVPDAVVAAGSGDLAAAHAAGVLSLADAATLAAARAHRHRPPDGSPARHSRPPGPSPEDVSLGAPRLPLLTPTGEPLEWRRLVHTDPVDAGLAGATPQATDDGVRDGAGRDGAAATGPGGPPAPLAGGGDEAGPGGATPQAVGTTTMVQVGPGDAGGGAADPVVPLLLPGRSATDSVVTALARLHVRGLTVDWGAALAGRGGHTVVLPTYAFQRRRYWPDARPSVFKGVSASDAIDADDAHADVDAVADHAHAHADEADDAHQGGAGDDERSVPMPAEVERKDVVREYLRRLSDGDVDGAAALYAEDGRIEDPVGSTPHIGREAVRTHIASVVRDAKLEVTVGEPCAAQDGVRVAVPLVASVVQPADPSGPRVQINCVDVVSVGEDGLITEILSFWGLSDIAM